MGCSGSKGTGPRAKFDDNKALREKSLQELTPAQLKAMVPLWKVVVHSMVNSTSMALMTVMSVDETKATAKIAFQKADSDMDDYLNKEEGAAFFAELSPEDSEANVKCYCDAATSLSDKEGHFKWEDFERVFTTITCWVEAGKAQPDLEAHMKAQMAKMTPEQRQAIAAGGDSEA